MTEKYSLAPIVFLDDEKRKEWDEMDPELKKRVFSVLHTCMKEMELKIVIEMLCNIIIDMNERIKLLEENNKRYSC